MYTFVCQNMGMRKNVKYMEYMSPIFQILKESDQLKE